MNPDQPEATKPDLGNDMTSKEIIYFGCIREAGHYWFSQTRRGLRSDCTPWRNAIDGGLWKLRGNEGEVHHFQKDGWTVIDFVDNSVDRRPGSHSAFAVHELLTADALLAAARVQWPEIFTRYRFKVTVPTSP